MREQIARVVNQYVEAIRCNDASAIPLHPDVIAEFPMSTSRGIASFREGMDRFAKVMKRIDVLHLLVDGEHCVLIADIDTVFGRIPFAELIRVVDGRIVSVRGYYDPRPMLDATKTPG